MSPRASDVRLCLAALVLGLALGCGEETQTDLWARLGDAEAQLALADRLAHAEGDARDAARAADWYRKAAEQGSASAQLALANLLESDARLARDPGEANRWILAAAEGGAAEAQLRMAEAHARGLGVPADPAVAIGWYRKAAEQGVLAAQSELARRYESGDGVKADPGEADRWLRKAAESGDAQLQLRLGMQYGEGRGVPARQGRGGALARSAPRRPVWPRRSTDWRTCCVTLSAHGRTLPAPLAGTPPLRSRGTCALPTSWVRCTWAARFPRTSCRPSPGRRAWAGRRSRRPVGTGAPPSRGSRPRRPVWASSTPRARA